MVRVTWGGVALRVFLRRVVQLQRPKSATGIRGCSGKKRGGAGAGVTCITAGFEVYLLNCDADEDRVVGCCCCGGGGMVMVVVMVVVVVIMIMLIIIITIMIASPQAKPAMDVHLNPSAQAARL